MFCSKCGNKFEGQFCPKCGQDQQAPVKDAATANIQAGVGSASGKQRVRGTSSVPMVLGLIGGILGLPSALCSGACVAGISTLVGDTSAAALDTVGFYMYTGLIAAVIAIVFACLAKRNPILSGVMLLIATGMTFLTMITFNFLTLIVGILMLIAGVFSFAQKKEIIQ